MTLVHETPTAKSPADAAPLPYRLPGLVVSTILIVVAALALCGLAAGLAFAGGAMIYGVRPVVEAFGALRASVGSETIFLQRIGLVASIAVYAALIMAVILAARIRAGRRWRDLLGLRAWNPFRGSRLFWVLVVATLAYSFVADTIVSDLYPPSKDWVTLPTGPVWGAMFILLAVIFAPVAEEVLFRGWIYTALRARVGVWPGILVTSTLFAIAHWETTHLYALAVFPVGVVLGIVRERTQNLTASMTFHALYNAGASLVLLAGR